MNPIITTLRGKIVLTITSDAEGDDGKKYTAMTQAELTPQEARRLILALTQRVEQLRPKRTRKRKHAKTRG